MRSHSFRIMTHQSGPFVPNVHFRHCMVRMARNFCQLRTSNIIMQPSAHFRHYNGQPTNNSQNVQLGHDNVGPTNFSQMRISHIGNKLLPSVHFRHYEVRPTRFCQQRNWDIIMWGQQNFNQVCISGKCKVNRGANKLASKAQIDTGKTETGQTNFSLL